MTAVVVPQKLAVTTSTTTTAAAAAITVTSEVPARRYGHQMVLLNESCVLVLGGAAVSDLVSVRTCERERVSLSQPYLISTDTGTFAPLTFTLNNSSNSNSNSGSGGTYGVSGAVGAAVVAEKAESLPEMSGHTSIAIGDGNTVCCCECYSDCECDCDCECYCECDCDCDCVTASGGDVGRDY